MPNQKQRGSEDELGELHGELAKALLKRIRSTSASPADLNAARQFLKDNDIICDRGGNKDLNKLADLLPDEIAESYLQ